MERKMTSTKKTTVGLDKVIGLRVKAARQEASLSQNELGLSIGVTFQQVQKYEKAVNRISASTLADIAATVQKPITYFYDPVKYKPNTHGEAMAEFSASSIGAKLISAAMELNPVLQQSLIDLARNMSKVTA